MKINPLISVCMATFNGEAYVLQQIKSILNNLNPSDEIIIVDDFSNDKTVEIISNLKDKRIKIFVNNKNYGEIFSFNKALGLASNEFIFLSDQDDVWLNDRANLMIKELKLHNALLLTTNFSWINRDGHFLDIRVDGVSSKNSTKYFKNIIDIFTGKTNYYGCAMLLSKDLLKLIIPIPRFTEAHDLWIALAANVSKQNLHINNKTFLKRSHGRNASSTTSSRNLKQKIWSRFVFLISILILFKRKLFIKN